MNEKIFLIRIKTIENFFLIEKRDIRLEYLYSGIDKKEIIN